MAAALAAPAIIRAGILMPVKRVILPAGDGVALNSMPHPCLDEYVRLKLTFPSLSSWEDMQRQSAIMNRMRAIESMSAHAAVHA